MAAGVVAVVVAIILGLGFANVIPGFNLAGGGGGGNGSGATPYAVTFTEAGLPSGTSWSVTLAASTHSSATSTVTFSEPNGTYSFSVGAVAGYAATPSTGQVSVTGAESTQAILFSVLVPSNHTVTFTETGLGRAQSPTVLGHLTTVGDGAPGVRLIYDPLGDQLYVLNYMDDNVSVVNGSTHSVTATIMVPSGPLSGLYNPVTRQVYVTNYNEGSVSIIEPTTNTVRTTVPVGAMPAAMAYDPTTGDVYVANQYSNSVTIIAGSTDAAVATILVGHWPATVIFDPVSSCAYVANALDSSVSVIGSSTRTVVATIPVPGMHPDQTGFFSGAYDPVNGDVYLASSAAEVLNVIDPTTNTVVTTIPVQADPYGVLYNSYNGYVYVLDTGRNNVTVIDPATNHVVTTVGTLFTPFAAAIDPANGDVYVVDFDSNAVTVIGGSTNTPIAELVVSEDHPFTNPAAVAVGASGSVYVVDGYLPLLTIIGTGAAVQWSVTLNGVSQNSSTSTIVFLVPDGSYAFTVAPVPGFDANPSSGNLTVSGGAVNVPIAFVAAPRTGSPPGASTLSPC